MSKRKKNRLTDPEFWKGISAIAFLLLIGFCFFMAMYMEIKHGSKAVTKPATKSPDEVEVNARILPSGNLGAEVNGVPIDFSMQN